MTKPDPKLLDHLVLPVPSLKIARARYEALGFTVAPDGRHSIGTENCCVYFRNGTYLEPLAIGHRETVEAAGRKGNPFVNRDEGYRFRHGDDGFSMVVFTGQDARADKKAFRAAGYRTGKLVTVKRPGLKVRAVFAWEERAPDITLFRCERPGGPPEFPRQLVKHENGALRIARVTLGEQLPEDFQYYIQTLSSQREVRSHSFGMEFSLPNAEVSVLNRAGLKVHYGIEAPEPRGLRAFAFDLVVKDIAQTRALLSMNGIESRELGHRLIVNPAVGQGATIAFVEG